MFQNGRPNPHAAQAPKGLDASEVGGPTGAYCVRGPRGLGYAGRAEADDRPLELYEAAQRKAKHAIGHFLTSDAGRVIFCWGLLR